MKKILLMLVGVITLSLVACGGDDEVIYVKFDSKTVLGTWLISDVTYKAKSSKVNYDDYIGSRVTFTEPNYTVVDAKGNTKASGSYRVLKFRMAVVTSEGKKDTLDMVNIDREAQTWMWLRKFYDGNDNHATFHLEKQQ